MGSPFRVAGIQWDDVVYSCGDVGQYENAIGSVSLSQPLRAGGVRRDNGIAPANDEALRVPCDDADQACKQALACRFAVQLVRVVHESCPAESGRGPCRRSNVNVVCVVGMRGRPEDLDPQPSKGEAALCE